MAATLVVVECLAGYRTGPCAAAVCRQLWKAPVLEQWVSTVGTPSMQCARMELSRPEGMGVQFIQQVVDESLQGSCKGRDHPADGASGTTLHNGLGAEGLKPH